MKILKKLLGWFFTLGVAIIIALVIRTIITPTVVDGESMEPTLHNGDYMIILNHLVTPKTPTKGTIVVFKSKLYTESGKQKNLIKRVIGVPGDRITIKDGQVYINEKLLEESYINGPTQGDMDIVVPADKIFVMGDNRPNSNDSRSQDVGFVDTSSLVGNVKLRLYPFNKIQYYK